MTRKAAQAKTNLKMSASMTFLVKMIRTSLLAALLAGFAGAVVLHAQEKPAPPPDQKQTQDSPQDSTQGPSRSHSFGQRLTRETREAAGEDEEKDEKGQFKRSASVNVIAKKLVISVETAALISFLFNFGVIAGIFIWAARKYLPGAFSARTAAIQKAMQEAQKASDEARRRLADIESRLMRLDGEIGSMRDAAEKEAAAEESRIQAASEAEARKIVESAHQEIDAAAKAARRALTAYAADLAVALASKQIHVDDNTDQALVRNFTGNLTASSTDLGTSSGKARR